MVLEAVGQSLQSRELPTPAPGPGQLLLRVLACAVCRTDLHLQRGEVPVSRLPLILGHQVIAEVVKRGPQAHRFELGEHVGLAWLGSTCGVCRFCLSGRENLCDEARFTGADFDGGFAEFTTASADACFHAPPGYDPSHAAPLLCGGAIGFRALRLAGQAERLGLYGFGAAAHLIAQVARHQGRQVFAFTRPGDVEAQQLARELGVSWAGDSGTRPPVELDAAILFAPVGALVPQALEVTCKGGVVVCAGIHMTDLPSFPYRLLWGERVLRSVANVCRDDVDRFLSLATDFPLDVRVHSFPLEAANEALGALGSGRLTGTAVLEVSAG